MLSPAPAWVVLGISFGDENGYRTPRPHILRALELVLLKLSISFGDMNRKNFVAYSISTAFACTLSL